MQQTEELMQSIEEDNYQEYDYGGELEFTGQISSDYKQKIGIEILTQEEVFERLLKQINELQEVIPISFDALLEIFHQYQWNEQKLKENYFESEQQLLTELKSKGIIIEQKDLQQAPIIQNQNKIKECSICYESANLDNQIQIMQCGHQFCQSWYFSIYERSWVDFIEEKTVNNKTAFMGCMMAECQFKLSFSFIKQVTASKPKVFQGYIKTLCLRFIEENKFLTWCPGVDCQKCFQVTDVTSKEVHCPCGQVFCFRCRDEVHVPAPCDMVQKWIIHVKKDEANMKWILVNTKLCPFCQRAVERNDGCNMMLCKPPGGCGKNFCYICAQPWEPTHSDHNKCNIYKPSKDAEMLKNKEKILLAKYSFFYERWLNSEAVKKQTQERKLTLPNIVKTIFDYINVSYIDSQFLETAVNELIESRGILKWSYCFAYHISNDQKSVDLFQNFMSQFEFACEQLAIQMSQIFVFVEGLQQTKGKDTIAHELFQKFSEWKIKIQSCMVICNKYRQNLCETINSGKIFIEKQLYIQKKITKTLKQTEIKKIK